jgi:hypothetical protein
MAGECTPKMAALACLKAYVDVSDEELKELCVTRDDCLLMARTYLGDGYTDSSLSTMFDQLARAFAAGKTKS